MPTEAHRSIGLGNYFRLRAKAIYFFLLAFLARGSHLP